ncbi:anhydro-N-acetylmuramic acid kinase [Seonamhaeicola marinus]|uniref:Anhydro-N-acetylmuramic acid kinase n=2 Tax=Seonamhaeicola marinus TaxID=1912246 RepID=A0A5D0HTW1_9FLAO|nr:anhydro-N-acetylmuramic acid kinase [Seonamhaeicola marinus]
MIKNNYKVIGVMSGTSLDGIDLIYASFELNNTWSFNIIKAETIPYSNVWKTTLKSLVSLSFEEIKKIDKSYTTYLASVIKDFINANHIQDIDAVCSHGHTALHQPDKGLTYQIGNREALSKLLKQRVVCDFRVQDVELGGQGAPLVPIGDELLFSEFDFCINFGGFANISTHINNQRIAYDICPVNIVMNHYVKTLGLEYDDEGKLASKGDVNYELLQSLNALDFYNEKPPKSLGLEWVNSHVFPLIDSKALEVKDVLRTFVEHVAIQVFRSLGDKPKGSVLITGGGAYNSFLIKRIKELTQNKIVIPLDELVEFKEALIFCFLGILRLRNENNCLQSVTGASRNHSSGKIFHA